MTDVLYDASDRIATITINRPAVHNAFRERTMLELIEAFDKADAAKDVGVIVLTGTGTEAFSTGGDVAMEDRFDPAEGHRMARLLMRLAEAVRGTGKPVIAKIRGWCVGGGNELALMCDFALAAETARFAQTDARLGSSPVWFATQLLPQLVGSRRAKEILMMGEHYSATAAAAMGWINRAVPDDELDALVATWCNNLLASSPQALRLTKVSVDFQADQMIPSVRHGFEVLAQMYGTAEFHEGTSAYLENRPPDFRNAQR
jgi:naphthoate synthase/2-ketocyclohexanecarboxyl-CoA hydrolase